MGLKAEFEEINCIPQKDFSRHLTLASNIQQMRRRESPGLCPWRLSPKTETALTSHKWLKNCPLFLNRSTGENTDISVAISWNQTTSQHSESNISLCPDWITHLSFILLGAGERDPTIQCISDDSY